MYSIGVVGGRYFEDYDKLVDVVIEAVNKAKANGHEDIRIVSGGARGADSLAERFAREHNLYLIIFAPNPAYISEHGFKYAAMYRNGLIVENSDELIAFPTKNSRGTWQTVKMAKNKKKPCKVVKV